jgi:hypothetical protein
VTKGIVGRFAKHTGLLSRFFQVVRNHHRNLRPVAGGVAILCEHETSDATSASVCWPKAKTQNLLDTFKSFVQANNVSPEILTIRATVLIGTGSVTPPRSLER